VEKSGAGSGMGAVPQGSLGKLLASAQAGHACTAPDVTLLINDWSGGGRSREPESGRPREAPHHPRPRAGSMQLAGARPLWYISPRAHAYMYGVSAEFGLPCAEVFGLKHQKSRTQRSGERRGATPKSAVARGQRWHPLLLSWHRPVPHAHFNAARACPKYSSLRLWT